MDIYQILTTYNHIWSMKEMLIALLILSVTIISTLFLYRNERMNALQAITVPILIAFLLIVLGSTVFGRIPGVRSYKLIPFWSYVAIIRGNPEIRQEVLLNCVLLFPAGMLLPLIISRPLKWYQGLIFGTIVSGCIELLQLITCRGLFEFDDIIHNSLGCMVGCILCSWMVKVRRRRSGKALYKTESDNR